MADTDIKPETDTESGAYNVSGSPKAGKSHLKQGKTGKPVITPADHSGPKVRPAN